MDKTLYHLSKRFRQPKYLLLILLVVLSTQSCRKNNSDIRILFVGDILLSRNVKEEIQNKKSSPWVDLMPLFQSADLVIGNLEGAVGKQNDQSLSDSDSPVFDIDDTHIPLLSEAGFKIITLENNHSYDLGKSGKENTIKALRNVNITPVYLENSPQFFTVKDVVIALVTIDLVPGRDSFVTGLPSLEIKQKLRLAGTLANLVIVSIHWGAELLEWPDREQRETAEWLVKNGADLIIGSHPHIIQKPEIIQGYPVFFSLGNHLFDQKYPGTKEGLIADIRIHNGKFECSGIITHTKAASFYPEIIETKDFEIKPSLLRNKPFKIDNYLLKPLSLSDKGQNSIVLEAFQKGKKIWSTPPMSIISISSSKLDGENEYLFTLESHYSSLDRETNIRPYVYDVDNMGLIAKWRGSALAWPLLDAAISPYNNQILCALHRGDSFINLDASESNARIAAYIWNGFGFSGLADSVYCESCKELFSE